MTYPVPTFCPICDDQLTVTKLHCHTCNTTFEGQFSQGRLSHLTAEELQFVETFVICEGKINRVEQELEMSYPAVRAKLQEIIDALGRASTVVVPPPAPASPPPAISEQTREAILAKLASGEISSTEALSQLRQS